MILIDVSHHLQQVTTFGISISHQETYVTWISKFLYKNFSRTPFFANTSTGGNISRTHLTRVFEKVSILCIFSKNSFSRKIQIEIISKTVVICLCEVFSSLVIFSKTLPCLNFSRMLNISDCEITCKTVFSINLLLRTHFVNYFETLTFGICETSVFSKTHFKPISKMCFLMCLR